MPDGLEAVFRTGKEGRTDYEALKQTESTIIDFLSLRR